jgi:WD40 repeat protein
LDVDNRFYPHSRPPVFVIIVLLYLYIRVAGRPPAGSDNRGKRTNDPAGREHALSVLDHNEFVVALAFSPDGKVLATADRDGGPKLWSVPTWKEITFYTSASDWFTSVPFSPDGRTLAAGHRDTSIVVWDLERTSR